MKDLTPSDYEETLTQLKHEVRTASVQARRRVNTELMSLYWRIGRTLSERSRAEAWGSKVVSKLADDLRAEFPEMKGFSARNLQYMRAFAEAWPQGEIAQQPAAQLPWGHIMVVLDSFSDQSSRDWYAAQAAAHGWSRNVLTHQIKTGALQRLGAAPSNFDSALAPADSELAQQLTKDPYVFDFFALAADAKERDLEDELTKRMIETLREFGPGFAFVGRQVHFDVDGDDFFVDLLFFHTEQLRYVVVELKAGKFEPSFVGQLGFYVNLVDARMRRPQHADTVGVLLVAGKNEAVVQYALGGAHAAVAVSSYELLPSEVKQSLPTREELVRALWPDSPENWG